MTLLLTTGPALATQNAKSAESLTDQAVAFGLLLDTPVPNVVLQEGVILAEKLRLIYGIDTGDIYRDRQAAAERAQAEVLEPLTFTTEQIKAAAADLGYRLEPAHCLNFCRNVEKLAQIELEKRALRAFAEAFD